MTRLTTHVLDVTKGLPAAGVAIELARLDIPEVLARTTTDADGRTGEPLATDLEPGRYVLTYGIGDYFGTDEYLDVVPIRFGVPSGAEHVHVALLVTPWSYTTYRGS
ncbi:MAG: uraH [Actinomycetia bacterium]|nr:uraH [Actinomycetes bacterium]